MLKVYYWDISDIKISELNLINFPKVRLDYINSISNEDRKKQSICVWFLLNKVLEILDYDVANIDFNVSEDGKWSVDQNLFYFSLTHSLNIVAVAISDSAVGIDVELFSNKILKLEKKLLKQSENISIEEKIENLTKCWTEKEAIYKANKKLPSQFVKLFDDKGNVYGLSIANIENCSVHKFTGNIY